MGRPAIAASVGARSGALLRAGPSPGRRARAARPGRRRAPAPGSRPAGPRSGRAEQGRDEVRDAGAGVVGDERGGRPRRLSPPSGDVAATGVVAAVQARPGRVGRRGARAPARTMDAVRVSTRGDYASRALLSLALHADARPDVGPRHRRAHRPPPALPRADPPRPQGRRAGALEAGRRRRLRAGPGARRTSRLSDIVSAVDGPITVGDFGEPHQDGACDHEGQCVLLAIWADVGEHMRHHLDGYTLADIASHGPRRGALARAIDDHVASDAPRPRPSPPDHGARSPTSSVAARRSTAARSARQRGVERQRRSPVTGWSKARCSACRNGRGDGERRRGRPP